MALLINSILKKGIPRGCLFICFFSLIRFMYRLNTDI